MPLTTFFQFFLPTEHFTNMWQAFYTHELISSSAESFIQMGKLGLWEVKERAPLPSWLPSGRSGCSPHPADSTAHALSTTSATAGFFNGTNILPHGMPACGMQAGLGNSSPGAGAPRVTKPRPLSRSSGHGVPSGRKELWKGCFEGYRGKEGGGLVGSVHLCWHQFGSGGEPWSQLGRHLSEPSLFLLCMGSPASGPQRWCEIWQNPWSDSERLLPTEPKTISIELFKRTCFVLKKNAQQ